jgi:hypothetical protein
MNFKQSTPKWTVYDEKSIGMDDLGVSHCWKPSINVPELLEWLP